VAYLCTIQLQLNESHIALYFDTTILKYLSSIFHVVGVYCLLRSSTCTVKFQFSIPVFKILYLVNILLMPAKVECKQYISFPYFMNFNLVNNLHLVLEFFDLPGLIF
jgi:hypothetical protein